MLGVSTVEDLFGRSLLHVALGGLVIMAADDELERMTTPLGDLAWSERVRQLCIH